MASIRIARIITRLDVSGPARHVCSLTAHLNHEKFKSWLICGHAAGNECDGSAIAAEVGVTPIYVDQLRRGLGPWDVAASIKVNRLLKDIRPTIVATHTAKAGALGRIVGLWRQVRQHQRIRLIHTFHGHVFHHYFNNAATRAFVAIERRLASLTDMIVTVSPTVRRELIEKYQITSANKVRVVSLGFDFSWVEQIARKRGWLRAELGAADSTVIFGTVGRLAKIKNTALLLRAFARMFARERIDARLVVIGDGDQRESLQMLARELAIDDRVEFCGWLFDRAQIFSDLDVTCLTSYNEGTPVSIIESLAAGVPVIATRVGGVEDLMTDGMDGELVESGDEVALASALLRIAKGYRHISPERSKAVRAHYSATRLVNDIESLYEEVLQNEESQRGSCAKA